MTLLLRSGVRELLRHRAQTLLAVAGIALGVAVGVAVDVTNESARRAFRLATEATAGRTTDQVVGGALGLDEALYPSLRELADAAPAVEGRLRVDGGPRLRLVGLDPLAGAAAGLGDAGLAGELDLAAFLTEPGAVVLSLDTAQRLGVAVGDRLAARVGAWRGELAVTGVFEPPQDRRTAFEEVAFADVATAQELLGRIGRLDRIDLVLPQGAAGAALRERLRSRLPPDARLLPAGARATEVERLTRAFRFNLRALSGLALLCGLFLVFNTVTFSVVRRRELFARLRAVGARRDEIVRLVLAEAALLGLVGSALGAGAGLALARGLVRQVLSTIDDLYFTVGVTAFAAPPSSLLIGVALGVGGAIAAALPPALEATGGALRGTLAVSELGDRSRVWARRAAGLGLLLVLFGGLLFVPRTLVTTLGGFLALVVGAVLAVPAALAAMMPFAARLGGPSSRLAARGVVRSLARTGPAAAALTLALAVSLAVALTITSFRGAVGRWLDATLVGDLYVSAPSGPSGPVAPLPEGLAERLAAVPGVARVQSLSAVDLPAEGDGPAPRLLGVATDPLSWRTFDLLEGDSESARRAVASGRAAVVSQPYAEPRGLAPGDTIRVLAPDGERRFELAGIYVDYGFERGAIAIDEATLRRAFPGAPRVALALSTLPGVEPGPVRDAVAGALPGEGLEVRSNGELKRYSLAVFDRTFRVTGVLRSLTLVVAALGIAAALAALELERARGAALLRALGLTRWGLATRTLVECGWLGAGAAAAALPLGAALAALLVDVVQRRSFGWSFPLELAARPFVETLALGVAAAIAAGAVSALRLALRAPVEALREE